MMMLSVVEPNTNGGQCGETDTDEERERERETGDGRRETGERRELARVDTVTGRQRLKLVLFS